MKKPKMYKVAKVAAGIVMSPIIIPWLAYTFVWAIIKGELE